MDIVTVLQQFPGLALTLVGLMALFVGSFLNVVIYRLPRMLERAWNKECHDYLALNYLPAKSKPFNLCLPGSHCPACKNPLRPWHTMPVISYLLLGGRCAYCHTKIALRYPLVEIITCLCSMYVARHFGFSWQTPAALVFTWVMIALFFIDLATQLLPDELTQGLVWLGLICSIFSLFCSTHDAIIGAIAGYLAFAVTALLFYWVTGKSGMGHGDFKLLAALGAFLGWKMLPMIILFSSLLGVVCTSIYLALTRRFKSVPLPFGPYLAIAGWMALLWGNDLLACYLNYIGYA